MSGPLLLASRPRVSANSIPGVTCYLRLEHPPRQGSTCRQDHHGIAADNRPPKFIQSLRPTPAIPARFNAKALSNTAQGSPRTTPRGQLTPTIMEDPPLAGVQGTPRDKPSLHHRHFLPSRLLRLHGYAPITFPAAITPSPRSITRGTTRRAFKFDLATRHDNDATLGWTHGEPQQPTCPASQANTLQGPVQIPNPREFHGESNTPDQNTHDLAHLSRTPSVVLHHFGHHPRHWQFQRRFGRQGHWTFFGLPFIHL